MCESDFAFLYRMLAGNILYKNNNPDTEEERMEFVASSGGTDVLLMT